MISGVCPAGSFCAAHLPAFCADSCGNAGQLQRSPSHHLQPLFQPPRSLILIAGYQPASGGSPLCHFIHFISQFLNLLFCIFKPFGHQHFVKQTSQVQVHQVLF